MSLAIIIIMKLTNEQITILEDGRIEDNKFYLQGQLDRKQYTSINEVLETIGLKRSRKDKAHIADCSGEELIEAIDDIIDSREVETLKETIKKFQFYETPKEVAEYLVELANIQVWEDVLEPSSWHGAIVDEINKSKCRTIFMYELDQNKVIFLVDKYHNKENRVWDRWYSINQWDFLNMLSVVKVPKIIANPPFSKSQDVKHILKMYETLYEGGRLVSVASASIKTREGKLYEELRNLNPEYYDLPEWSFKESWTMVNTVIVVINK